MHVCHCVREYNYFCVIAHVHAYVNVCVCVCLCGSARENVCLFLRAYICVRACVSVRVRERIPVLVGSFE